MSLTDEEIGRVIRAALSQGSTPAATDKPKAKSAPKKKPRKPSAYNQYMKKELAKLKKKHPRTNHQARFKKAAKSWKRSAERKRSLK